jgi:hypothetical protein
MNSLTLRTLARVMFSPTGADLHRAQEALPEWRVVLTPTGRLLATRQPGTQWAELHSHSADRLIEGCRHIERAEPAAAAPPMQYR